MFGKNSGYFVTLAHKCLIYIAFFVSLVSHFCFQLCDTKRKLLIYIAFFWARVTFPLFGFVTLGVFWPNFGLFLALEGFWASSGC